MSRFPDFLDFLNPWLPSPSIRKDRIKGACSDTFPLHAGQSLTPILPPTPLLTQDAVLDRAEHLA